MAPPLEAEKNRSESDIRQAIFSLAHDDQKRRIVVGDESQLHGCDLRSFKLQ
jgi:hypothetical protein